jgi:hypothetical protein
MNRSLDLGMMTTTDFWSPPDKALNYQNPSDTVPIPPPQIPILHTNREQGTSIPGDNMDENKVLVCYPNPDQILAGLSSSTQNTLTILLYGVTKE